MAFPLLLQVQGVCGALNRLSSNEPKTGVQAVLGPSLHRPCTGEEAWGQPVPRPWSREVLGDQSSELKEVEVPMHAGRGMASRDGPSECDAPHPGREETPAWPPRRPVSPPGGAGARTLPADLVTALSHGVSPGTVSVVRTLTRKFPENSRRGRIGLRPGRARSGPEEPGVGSRSTQGRRSRRPCISTVLPSRDGPRLPVRGQPAVIQ